MRNRVVIALVAISTVIWLAYVGLYPHEIPCGRGDNRCPTIYGHRAPLPDGYAAGTFWVVAGFLVPAALVGWRRLTSPHHVAACLAGPPLLLAGWTAPRFDNDGLGALIFPYIMGLGCLAAFVAVGAECIRDARAAPRDLCEELVNARLKDRLTALVIDGIIVGVLLAWPLAAIASRDLGVPAFVGGVAAAVAYLTVSVAWKGRTIGQALLGLHVIDPATNQRITGMQAFLRSVLIVAELAASITVILGFAAVAEFVALDRTGRTLTDRLIGTSVVSKPRHVTPREPSADHSSTQPHPVG